MQRNQFITDKLTLTLMSGIIFLFVSCQKWLDVRPDNETEAGTLFSSERGFQEALSGVYTLVSEPELYGRELSFGMADVLAQQYGQLHEVSPYFYTQYYEFRIDKSLALTDAVWKKQCNAIANVNDLLAFIDKKEKIFASTATYSIIKGEALALRAFLHFDLLRYYAPVKAADGGKWLPYIDEFTKNTTASLSYDAFTGKLLADLLAAEKLLKADPIFTGTPLPDIYYRNRQYHLNYYAVKGLLARVYLYIGDDRKAAAYACAKEVIAAQQTKGLFPFVSQLDATNADRNKRDRTFSTEHLFTLNIRSMQTAITGYLSQAQSGLALLPREMVGDIFEGYPDYRKEFFETDGSLQNVPSKFWQVDPSNRFKYKMPVIRISEMYYIAAETAPGNQEACGYLNTVRQARNVTDNLSGLDNDTRMQEIRKEYKKEFFGEGQLFAYYKRTQAPDAGPWTIPFKFVLPMPEDEINFGGRPRPN
ncbi:RagB/SusD family nutrient uptake outer membrane protein [Chitinophaga caseinilytica]|uniref:RagB/SusD family nutrient uptake outer membrane protein n=1 Tax=Chitinophaga caseinilytica TaxID=2267521 RepID=UPI003C2F86CA